MSDFKEQPDGVGGFDSSFCYATNSTTPTDIMEAMKKAEAIKAKMEFADAGFNLHSKCDPCPKCGHERRIESGTVFVCPHFWEAIKERVPRSESPAAIPSPLLGLRIIVETVA